ncbi:MAG: tetratricopeptide repeat protein [Planctomycetota bacterium]
MSLKGDLTTINLADIFQTLSLNKKTGILNVHCGQKNKKIFLNEGEIYSIALSYSEWAFGEFLLRQGFIDKAKYAAIVAIRTKEPGKSYESIIVEQGLYTFEQLQDLITLQIQEEIYDLFTWDGGDFQFEEGKEFLATKRSGIITDTHIYVNTSGLILEAARRADEWERFKKLIKSSKEIFKRLPRDSQVNVTLEETDMAVCEAVNGERDVSEITFAVNSGIFEVYAALFKMIRINMIAPLDIMGLLDVGKQSMAAGNYSKAVKVFERVNELEEDEPLYVRMYANALEKFGNLRTAAIQFFLLGTILSTQKNLAEAITYFQKVLEIIPDDTMTREKIAGIFETQNRPDLALEQYRILADIYYRNKAMDECQAMLRGILALDEADIASRKRLGEILVASGARDEGIIEYQIAAERLYATLEPADLAEALAIYEKIVAVDPSSPELRTELANMYTMSGRNADASREFMTIARLYEAMPDRSADGVNAAKWELLIDVYKQVLNIDPENIAAKEKIANALLLVGTSDQATDQLRSIAKDLQEKGDIVRSTEFLQRITSLTPSDLSSRFALANNLMSKGKFDDAISEFKGLMVAAKRAGELDKAEEACRSIIAMDPFEINAHKSLAEIFYKRGAVDKAVEKYKAVGMMCMGAGLDESALGCFNIVASLNPSDREIARLRADASLRMGNTDDAVAALGQLAQLQEKAGEIERALDVCRESLKLKPRTRPALEHAFTLAQAAGDDAAVVMYGKVLAGMQAQAGEIDAAIDVYEAIHKQVPGEIQVLNDFAVVLEKQGNIARACRFYRELSKFYLQNDMLTQSKNVILKAEKLMPEDTKIQLALGLIAAREGALEEAGRRFEGVTAREADNVVALRAHGDILVRMRKPAEALAKYQTAFTLLEKQQLPEEMIKLQEAIIALKPDEITAHVKLAELHQALGDEIKLNVSLADAARQLIAAGDKDRAYELYRQFLDRNPRLDNVRRAYFNLALDRGDKELAADEGVKLVRHWTERSDFENARVITDYILKFMPGHTQALIERDRIAFESGRTEAGLEGLKETVVALKNEDNLFRLKRHLRDIQKYVPANGGLHETMGAIHAKEGRLEEAVDEYQVAMTLFEEAGNTKAADNARAVVRKLEKATTGRPATAAKSADRGVKEIFKELDGAEDTASVLARAVELVQESALIESALLTIEEQCRAREWTEPQQEAQRRLIRLYLLKGVYMKAREIFETAGDAFFDDFEMLQLLAEAAERNGDGAFAKQCLTHLFREYDNLGYAELAAGVCARILYFEPFNRKAVKYIRSFADAKNRTTGETVQMRRETESEPPDADEQDRRLHCHRLLEACQEKLKDLPADAADREDLQAKFINALTEESLGSFDESIRIFNALLQEL